MFGENEIVGASLFKDKTKLLITSVFGTLQGEGPLSGVDMIRGIGAGGGGGYIRTSIQALGVVHRLYNLVNKIEKEVLRINSSLECIDAKIGSPTPPPNEDSNVR